MAEHAYDIWVDFMTMRDDGEIWTRLSDVRAGFVPIAGRYAIVGSDEADPAVAHILSVDLDDGLRLRVLDGSVDDHRHLLASGTS